LFLAIFAICRSEAQAKYPDIPYMDSTMAAYLQQINFWSSYINGMSEPPDTLVHTNNRLMEYLKMVAADPHTIYTSFPLAEGKGLMSITSSDGKLRVYAWDTWTGGSMHYFNSLAQYNAVANVNVKVLNDVNSNSKSADPGAYYTEMNTIAKADGKTAYLITDCTIASKTNKANGIHAYEIDGNDLKKTMLFKTRKHISDFIDFVYDVSYDSINAIIVSIHFSPDKRKLYIPVVLKNGRLANEYWVYVFKGDKYVYKKRVKGLQI